jgi:hypothetical protein
MAAPQESDWAWGRDRGKGKGKGKEALRSPL